MQEMDKSHIENHCRMFLLLKVALRAAESCGILIYSQMCDSLISQQPTYLQVYVCCILTELVHKRFQMLKHCSKTSRRDVYI